MKTGGRAYTELTTQTQMAEIRILLAEDFEPWRVCIRELLQLRPAWRLVFEARDGLEAVEKAAELRPNIVLLDLEMPLLNGIEAARRILHACPESKIIFVSQNSDSDVMLAALATGAKAYVRKESAAQELLSVIESVIGDSA